ncbi:MAG: recombination mediator RecR [Armatimonadota bacterium]
MPAYPRSLANLLAELEKLPGVGPKTAQRLALHLLRASVQEAEALAAAIAAVKQQIRSCPICFNYTDQEICGICSETDRDESVLCVVADARDLLALERAGGFRGRYHVLGGLISPMDGVGPDSLRIGELIARVKAGGIREVILATNPTVEGDATAVYIADLLRPLSVRATRIALGLPVGGDLDYADDVTITRAVTGRTEI